MRNKIAWSVGVSCLMVFSAVRADVISLDETHRGALAVTLYNQGMALIEDQREAKLPKGNNELHLYAISPKLVPETVQLLSNGPFELIEQGLLPANLNQSELLKAFEGKTLKLIKTHPTTGEEVSQQVDIISASPQLIVRIDGQIETSIPGRIVFPEIPASLRAKPVFLVIGRAGTASEGPLNLQYLTHGLSWRADHVASFDDTSTHLQLKTRATFVNNSGLDLLNSQIQMVAGQVNQVTPQRRVQAAPRLMKAQSMAMADTEGAPARQSLGGYHLYSLRVPIDLAAGQTKQVALLPVQSLPAKRMLVSNSHPNIYGRGGVNTPSHPDIQIELKNQPTGSTKQPLPAGTLRLYGKDHQGRAQFLGENQLANLPVGETATLITGQAFDVTVRRQQTDFKRDVMGRNTFETAFSVRVLNGSNEPETVIVKENLSGDWTFTQDSTAFKRNGTQAVWTVKVPAGGEASATYRVRVRR